MNDVYYGMYGGFHVPPGQFGGEMSHMDQMRLADDFRHEPPILPRPEETMRFSDPISSGHDTSARFTLPEPPKPLFERLPDPEPLRFTPPEPLVRFEPDPPRAPLFEWERPEPPLWQRLKF